MTKTRCSLCRKKIEIRVKECDESGMTWHCYCFRCYVCGTLLNEVNVKIRGDDKKLYCGSHAIFEDKRKESEESEDSEKSEKSEKSKKSEKGKKSKEATPKGDKKQKKEKEPRPARSSFFKLNERRKTSGVRRKNKENNEKKKETNKRKNKGKSKKEEEGEGEGGGEDEEASQQLKFKVYGIGTIYRITF